MPALLAVTALLVAAPGCTRGSEYEPALCPLHLPAIREIVIDRSGAGVSDNLEGRRSCAAFRPTAAQMRRYFAAAGTTDAQSADATVDRSPCFAQGRIRLTDGRVARWRIESLRAGTLWFRDPAGQMLYCRSCRFKPFVW